MIVEVAGTNSTIEFPDGTSPEDIQRAMEENQEQFQAPAPVQAQAPAEPAPYGGKGIIPGLWDEAVEAVGGVVSGAIDAVPGAREAVDFAKEVSGYDRDFFDWHQARQPKFTRTELPPAVKDEYELWVGANNLAARDTPDYDLPGAFLSTQGKPVLGKLPYIGIAGKSLYSPDHEESWKASYLDTIRKIAPGSVFDKDPDEIGLSRAMAADMMEVKQEASVGQYLSYAPYLAVSALRDAMRGLGISGSIDAVTGVGLDATLSYASDWWRKKIGDTWQMPNIGVGLNEEGWPIFEPRDPVPFADMLGATVGAVATIPIAGAAAGLVARTALMTKYTRPILNELFRDMTTGFLLGEGKKDETLSNMAMFLTFGSVIQGIKAARNIDKNILRNMRDATIREFTTAPQDMMDLLDALRKSETWRTWTIKERGIALQNMDDTIRAWEKEGMSPVQMYRELRKMAGKGVSGAEAKADQFWNAMSRKTGAGTGEYQSRTSAAGPSPESRATPKTGPRSQTVNAEAGPAAEPQINPKTGEPYPVGEYTGPVSEVTRVAEPTGLPPIAPTPPGVNVSVGPDGSFVTTEPTRQAPIPTERRLTSGVKALPPPSQIQMGVGSIPDGSVIPLPSGKITGDIVVGALNQALPGHDIQYKGPAMSMKGKDYGHSFTIKAGPAAGLDFSVKTLDSKSVTDAFTAKLRTTLPIFNRKGLPFKNQGAVTAAINKLGITPPAHIAAETDGGWYGRPLYVSPVQVSAKAAASPTVAAPEEVVPPPTPTAIDPNTLSPYTIELERDVMADDGSYEPVTIAINARTAYITAFKSKSAFDKLMDCLGGL